jgi:hypothetical protein
MESEGSLPSLQKPAISICPEPAEFGPHSWQLPRFNYRNFMRGTRLVVTAK